MEFEWDIYKDISNQVKHDVAFEEAVTVFSDQFARLIADPAHSDEEQRYILLGMSQKLKLLVVVHCLRESDTIRIISARKANRREQRTYERFTNA